MSKIEAKRLLDLITGKVAAVESENNSLFGGRLGTAFYFGQLFAATGDHRYRKTAVSHFNEVVDAVANNEAKLYGRWLSTGLCGLLYVAQTFTRKGLINWGYDRDLRPLIDHLTQYALGAMETDDNDIFQGSFGVLYTIAICTRNFGDRRFLDALLARLEERTRALGEQPWVPCKNPTGGPSTPYVDFSLSHGQAGLLLVLFFAYAIAPPDDRRLQALRRCLHFVICRRSEVSHRERTNYFPSWLDLTNGTCKTLGRLAWCYGDLGHVLLLYRAADFFGEDRYRALAGAIGQKTLARTSPDRTFITDAHLCHGASGVAQFYRVLNEETGFGDYRQAYEYWIGQAVSMTKREIAEDGTMGFPMNLVSGPAGVGLTLMSYLYDGKTDWCKILLL